MREYLPLSDGNRSAFADEFSQRFFEFSQSQRYLFEDPLVHLKAFPDYWRQRPFEWPDRWAYRSPDSLAAYLQEAADGYDRLSAILMATWLPANCLHISDKLGLGNGIEVRAPFLDHKLIEFTFSLPVEWRFSAREPKPFLKQSLRGIVPDKILDAPKQGFSTPDHFLARIVAQSRSELLKVPHHHFHTVLIERLLSQHQRRWAPQADRGWHQNEHSQGVSSEPTGNDRDSAKTTSARAYQKRGELLYGQGDLPGARQQFQQALALNEAQAAVHNNLAVLAWQEGRVERAAASFMRALELAPDDPETLANCTDMLIALDSRTEGNPSQASESSCRRDIAEASDLRDRLDRLSRIGCIERAGRESRDSGF